jgi:hypothetical protein
MLDIVNEVHATGAYRVSVLVEKRQILREFGSITGYHHNSACAARLSSCPRTLAQLRQRIAYRTWILKSNYRILTHGVVSNAEC